ncbi:MAG: 16S rRNA (guanine(527)-N(7))-methyltransferase RsmG [Bifidobacterium sp.]|nr:16S rRNA (guanine(527)-N(7))-methyltransferase RsmG [Bifidobacterium sp.]
MQYAESLATDGIIRGLIGPRETPRLWDRHILNCAVIGEAIPEAATVVDIGSGGGLPGIPLAIARPDLQITLVEPMLRRTTYLEEIIEKLGLTNVRVLRGKAQNPDIVREAAGAQVVTSRAVASLGALAEMSMPLLAMGGHMMAMKGDIVQEEIDRDAQTIADCGGSPATARVVGGDLLEHPTYLAITQRVGTARRPSKKTTKKSRKPAGAAGTQRKQSGERRHSAPDGSRATTYRASRDSDRWDGRQYRGPRDGDRRDSGQYRGPRDGDRRDGGQYRGESGRYYSGGRSRRGDGGQDHYGHRGTGRRANPFRRDGGTGRNGR